MRKLHDKETEENLIGMLLLDPEAFGKLDGLKPEHFYSYNLATIYESIHEINLSGKTADLLTVAEHLTKTNKLENIGGAFFLTQLQERVYSSASIEQCEDRIIEYYRKRVLYNSLLKTIERIDTLDSGEIISELSGVLHKSEDVSGGFKTMTDSCNALIEKLEQGRLEVYSTGFYDLDRLLGGGLQPGSYFVVAAQTSMGKTSLVLGSARHIAEEGLCVGIVSLEMTAEELIQRIALQKAKIKEIVTSEGKKRLIRALSDISKLPIYIDDSGCSNFAKLFPKLRLLIRQRGIKVLIIDYVQLLFYKGDTRNLEIQAISRMLRNLAQSEKIVVIVVSQLNRDVKCFPVLSNLRDSGALEQDATNVLFIHRPEQLGISEFEGEATDGIAFCALAKNRNGATGRFKLFFQKEYARFCNIEKYNLNDDSQTKLPF